MPVPRRAGFSIIELVIFLAALVVLIVITAPRLVRMLERERTPVSIEMVRPLPDSLTTGPDGDTVAFRIIGRNGEPVRHGRVELRSSSAFDSIAPARPAADAEGVARAVWRVRGDAGARTLRVTVPGTPIDTSFTTVVAEPGEAQVPAAERTPAPDTAPGAGGADSR